AVRGDLAVAVAVHVGGPVHRDASVADRDGPRTAGVRRVLAVGDLVAVRDLGQELLRARPAAGRRWRRWRRRAAGAHGDLVEVGCPASGGRVAELLRVAALADFDRRRHRAGGVEAAGGREVEGLGGAAVDAELRAAGVPARVADDERGVAGRVGADGVERQRPGVVADEADLLLRGACAAVADAGAAGQRI